MKHCYVQSKVMVIQGPVSSGTRSYDAVSASLFVKLEHSVKQ